MNHLLLACALLAGIAVSAEGRNAICRAPNDQNMIALTFDDGPNAKFSKPILEILDRQQVKATFFQVGKNMKPHPDISRLVASKGHEIGNHSMTHPRLPELATQGEIDAEIRGLQVLTAETTGSAPKVFRAPYLKFDDRVWAVLDELSLPAFNASVYADYKGDGDLNDPVVASAHVDAVVAKVKSGTIILMHEREVTLHYLDEVVGKLKGAGFTFVTASDLLSEGQ